MIDAIIKHLEHRLDELQEQDPYAIETIEAYQLVLYDLKGGEL